MRERERERERERSDDNDVNDDRNDTYVKRECYNGSPLYYIVGMSRPSFVVLTIAVAVSSLVYAQDINPGLLY